jgi:Arc/MetJ family transcription regulator
MKLVTVKIREDLVQEVIKITGIKNKNEAVTFALLWFIENYRIESQKTVKTKPVEIDI